MNKIQNFILGVLVLLFNPMAYADVVLVGKAYSTVASGRLSQYKKFLGMQIEMGFLDKRNSNVSLLDNDEVSEELSLFVQQNEDSDRYLRISAKTYKLANANLKSRMEDVALKILGEIYAWDVAIDQNSSNIKEEWIIDRFDIMSNSMHGKIRPEKLLSKFAQAWAEKDSNMNGPNCFYSAIASVNKGWTKPRFMSEQEFNGHINESFLKIDDAEMIGDVMVLYDIHGEPVHAATYVGHLQNGMRIYLSKNGKTPGMYLHMDEVTLRNHRLLYENTSASFFRSIAQIDDPAMTKKINSYYSNLKGN